MSRSEYESSAHFVIFLLGRNGYNGNGFGAFVPQGLGGNIGPYGNGYSNGNFGPYGNQYGGGFNQGFGPNAGYRPGFNNQGGFYPGGGFNNDFRPNNYQGGGCKFKLKNTFIMRTFFFLN